MAPGEEVVDDRLADLLSVQQHAQQLSAKDALKVLRVEPGERSEGAVRHGAAVGYEHVDMRVEVEQLACGLDKAHGVRADVGALEVGREVEPQGSPGTTGERTQVSGCQT